MKVFVTIVVEPTTKTGYESDLRDRFVLETGNAPIEEIAQSVQVAAYNMVEELVELARARL